MKYDIEDLNNQSNDLKILHQDEINNLTVVKDHIKKLNLSISSVNKDKEVIQSNIAQMKKHLMQLESKIIKQTKSTKEFLGTVVDFEMKIKKVSKLKENKTRSIKSACSTTKTGLTDKNNI